MMPDTDRPTTPNEACGHNTLHYHGTLQGYMTDLCRCDDCRSATTRYYRERRNADPYPLPDEDFQLEHFDLRTELPEWHLLAECRGGDHTMFFPNRGESTGKARATCAVCPVQPECLNWAIETKEPGGIWGGLSERERRKVRKEAAA